MTDNTDDAPPPEAPPTPGVVPMPIETELRRSYLDYAMSVIVSRAIPDVRDGLKPVHRRILFGMNEAGNTADKRYRKSANTVGEVMAVITARRLGDLRRLGPHGSRFFDEPHAHRRAGQFRFDRQRSAGAMRYTESKLAKAAQYLLMDIDEDTVDFRDNYDGERLEPTVLPARFPNILVNGGGGIAVGMATNIPPHNLVK